MHYRIIYHCSNKQKKSEKRKIKMAEFIEVDVRGLSCPEPVLLVMDAMDEHPGETIRVIGDEATQEQTLKKS